ncbi:type II secretion system minor pseudopilin GspK [Kordiimonas pumila]|uniref:Type II secretion system protein K n=1 Tax=Kordiimonas pumila TaxID=2161677 RepID=A0ABV7D6E6_9PROT|nr:type II secretion system minor pseudopilin GspK [Kordiimonas pumila]
MNRFLLTLQSVTGAITSDKGAALVMVMVIVSAMSAGAVLAFDTMNFSIRKTARTDMYDQARLYAYGGENIARIYAEKLNQQDQAIKNYMGLNSAQALTYPIDGGSVTGTLADASNCFNVNSLLYNPVDTVPTNDMTDGMIRYQSLLAAAGFADGHAAHLTATLKDWLDTDTRPSPAGAEDYDYALGKAPYRAANTLMADISELRLVKGYSLEVLEAIKPFLCVRPDSAPSALQVNSLLPYQAPLLVSLMGGKISLSEAAVLISERPSAGYASVAAFWKERLFNGMIIPQETRAHITLKPQAYLATIKVQFQDAVYVMASTIGMQDDGTSLVLSRTRGVWK